MNEQLIQEMAVHIDGQIAQACGSHDPNLKSNYIIQNYPQVRTCANYTDAVMMLAREQAALQAPPLGYSQPQQSFGQQQHSIGQLQSGFGNQHQQAFNQQPSQNQPYGAEVYQQQQQFGQAPPVGVFGTPAVPQTGQPGASQFTAFQPPKNTKATNGKLFGFIPQKVVVVVAIVIVASIVIGGIGVSIKNALNPKAPTTQTDYYDDTPTVDDLFDD